MQKLIAVPAADAIPNLTEWMVWGPMGVLLCYCLYLFWDYYQTELKTRAKEARSQARQAHENGERRAEEAHQAHIGFVNTTATCLPEIKDTLKVVVQRQDQHSEDISWIKRNIRPCNGRGDDPGEPPNKSRPS